MSRICELSGVGVQSGHNVSHSERKTKRKFLPNLHNVTLSSDVLKANFQFRVAARFLKTLEINGGLDSYLLSVSADRLSKKARHVRKKIKIATADSVNS